MTLFSYRRSLQVDFQQGQYFWLLPQIAGLSILVGCLSWAFITLNIYIAKVRRQYYKHQKWALVLEVVIMTVINSLLQMSLPVFGTCVECSELNNPGICDEDGVAGKAALGFEVWRSATMCDAV